MCSPDDAGGRSLTAISICLLGSGKKSESRHMREAYCCALFHSQFEMLKSNFHTPRGCRSSGGD
jgi:hypothetical protein